jgi:adenosylcobinamide-GDP ribazoletransferase
MMKGFELFQANLLSALLAKFVMVLQSNRGSSACQGLRTPFTQSKNHKKKIGVAGALALVPIVLVGGIIGVIVIAAGVVLSFVLLVAANRSFGGISGDVFGATNELVRLSSLLIFASV